LSVAGISTHAAIAQIDLVHAAYKGAAPLVQELIGGQVQAAWLDAATLAPLQQAGKIKVLAMTGTQRTSSLSQVPTFVELGLKGFRARGFLFGSSPCGHEQRGVGQAVGRNCPSDSKP
jgi:tripartite-type tricarboxylate transporter receptor subunit TctC